MCGNYELIDKIKKLASYYNYEGEAVSDEFISEIIEYIEWLEDELEHTIDQSY